ncbi:hypothetical protein [Nostoc sp.]
MAQPLVEKYWSLVIGHWSLVLSLAEVQPLVEKYWSLVIGFHKKQMTID